MVRSAHRSRFYRVGFLHLSRALVSRVTDNPQPRVYSVFELGTWKCAFHRSFLAFGQPSAWDSWDISAKLLGYAGMSLVNA